MHNLVSGAGQMMPSDPHIGEAMPGSAAVDLRL
jgi:hypothetical protein